jgi:hypothetical protein
VNIIIKDNFLDDYKEAKKLALSCSKDSAIDSNEYIFNDLISTTKRDTKKFQSIFRDLLKEEVFLVEDKYRKFNVCMEDPTGHHIHHDDVDYIGIVYLNDTYSEEDGTQFLRHKETGIVYRDVERFGSQFISDSSGDSRDITKWESYLFTQAKPNRLVLFEPLYYHSERRTFGNQWEDARCIEIFHMVKKDRIPYWCEYYGIDKSELELCHD